METELARPTRPAVHLLVVEGTNNSGDDADAQRAPKEGALQQGTGKGKKTEEGDAAVVTAPEAEGEQMEEEEEEKKKQRKRKRREEKVGRREWRRALREKEEEYWDALYDRGRRMVFGMGLPHDPRRGIQLLRRAAREARHAPARWELQCLMAVQPFGDTASKPVGLTDDSEAEAPSEDEEDDDVEAEEEEEEEGDDKRHTGSSTKKKKKKKKKGRGMKEREEEELEEEVKSKRKGKDKKKKKPKKKKTKNNGETTELKKEKKNKKRKKHSSAGSSRGSLQRECAEAINSGSAAAESAADDDDDDWEHNSAEDEDDVELDEITEAEFREVIAAIQRVRLTTLHRLGQTRSALNEAAAAARLSGFGDVGDATTGRHTYAMDWDKAVKAYRRHVNPVVVDIDGDAQGPTTTMATTTTASTSEMKTKRRGKTTPWRGSRKINPRWEKIASYNLGLCYFNGEGIAQNITYAAQLFQRAADLGYINGINSLGLCYYRGQGVELNIDKALSLFKLAADRGYVIAQYNLANCLGTGANGIYEKNLTTSACLYLRSSCQGDVAAFAHLLAVTRNPQYFGKKEVEYVVPTLFNQCLAKCWEEGLFGRHSWERNEGRRETSEPQEEERQTQKEKAITKMKTKTKKPKTQKKQKQKKKQKLQLQSSLERTETRRSDDGRLEMSGGVDSSEANAAHTSNAKKKKSKKKKKKPAKEEKQRDSRSRARAKARRRLEAAEKAAEDRRGCLPQEIVARMYERRNTCVRPECEQQFWGKGRVMWKFPLFLPSSSSPSSSSSFPAASASTSASTMAPTPSSAALASAPLLSLLSPAATAPGFGSVEEMVTRYLVYFEEEDRMEATTADIEGDGDIGDANRQSDPNGVTGDNNTDSTTSPAPLRPSSPPEGKVVWRKLLLPFCSVHCSQLTTTST